MEYNDSSDSSTSDYDDPPSKRSRMADNLDYLSSDDEGNDSSIAMSSDNPDADLFSNIFDSDESSNHTQSNQSLNSTHAESYYSTNYDYLTEWPDTSSSELSYVSSDHAINDTEPDSERNSFVYDADDFDFGSSSDDSTFGLTTAAATGTNNNANVPNTNINSSPTSSSTPCIASSSIQNPKVNVSNIWMPD